MAEISVKDAVFQAAKYGRADDMQALLRPPHNADPNIVDALGNTPLHYAAAGNHAAVAQIIIMSGRRGTAVDVNKPNNHGETPLHKAAARGAAKVANLLVSNGADTWIKDKDGKRAYDLATDGETKEAVIPLSKNDDDEDDDDEDPFLAGDDNEDDDDED